MSSRGYSRSRSPDEDDNQQGSKRRKLDDGGSKKMRKEDKKKEKVNSYFGYTPESNPFGDSNLYKPFVWGKKIEKDKAEGKAIDLSKKAFTEKRLAMKEEVDKVKERRMIRESEKEERDRLREEEERLKDASLFGDWQEKEEDFHRKQAKTRSKIRIREGREKPIDILAKNVLLFDGDSEDEDVRLDDVEVAVEINDPHLIFKGLPLKDLEELREDIKLYIDMQKDTRHAPFFHSLLEVCEDEMDQKVNAASDHGRGMHLQVKEELEDMFKDKTSGELQDMAKEIEADLLAGKGDAEYWEGVLKECKLASARARLHEVHVSMLQHRLETLRRNNREHIAITTSQAAAVSTIATTVSSMVVNEDLDDISRDDNIGSVSPLLVPFEDEDVVVKGVCSPPWLSDDEEYVEGEVDVDEEVDLRGLLMERESIRQRMDAKRGSLVNLNGNSYVNGDSVYESEKAKKLEADEDNLGDEIDLEKTSYWWQDKYKPRKPRYLNRVKTAYDWSQYNRTHYDSDNPPPKIVQGYKFSIFYPDLIDKLKAPTYTLEPADSPEFCLIRFHAGPPYEDIAFKIVAREWEHGKKQGFKCTFERGVLQLFFNFKRHRYRR